MSRHYYGAQKRTKWWTPERIAFGLRRFYKDFGFCPTEQKHYASHAQFSGIDPATGRRSNLGWHQKYPSAGAILRTFPTMRDAWRAAGLDVDSGYMEWSAIEDWFVLESCGILPRTEVAAILKRTVPAVKRRLYDLGNVTANTRWGITLSGAASLCGISYTILQRYLTHGKIPYFRGYKLIYLNPADLLEVKEIDWTGDINPWLEHLVRVSQIQRILKIIKFGPAWRDREIYKFNRDPVLYTLRIKNERVPESLKETPPPPPNDLAVGDWVRMTGTNALGVDGRVGLLKAIYYSPQTCDRRDGSYRKCWMARVEFPRLRHSAVSNDSRIRYSVPLDRFLRTEKPEITPPPLSMHPEAVRGRKRKLRGEFGRIAGQHLAELRGALT